MLPPARRQLIILDCALAFVSMAQNEYNLQFHGLAPPRELFLHLAHLLRHVRHLLLPLKAVWFNNAGHLERQLTAQGQLLGGYYQSGRHVVHLHKLVVVPVQCDAKTEWQLQFYAMGITDVAYP